MNGRQLLFLGFLTIMLLALAQFVTAGACCMVPYQTNTLSVQPLSDTQNAGACSAQQVYIENCFEGSFNDIGEDGLTFVTKYCCNQTSGEEQRFGAGENIASDEIYAKYCEAQGYTAQDSPCSASLQEEYYNISGFISFSQEPVQGATVQVTTQSAGVLIATTNESGYYEIAEVPGVEAATHQFTIIAPDTISYEDEFYTCPDKQLQQTINENTQVNASLDCTLATTSCDAHWVTTEWSYSCQPFGGQYVRIRDVYSSNATCEPSTPKPPSINATGCQDEPVGLTTCGNGILNIGEQCDPGSTVDTNPIYRTLQGEETSTPLSCGNFSGYEDTSDISCTTHCTYDFSHCKPECGTTCVGPWQCGICSACEGSDLCTEPCDEMAPQFLDSFMEEHADEHNVLALHAYYMENPTLQEGKITYFEGTSDVQISWYMNTSCQSRVQHYEVRIKNLENNEFQTKIVSNAQTSYRFNEILESESLYEYNVCAKTVSGNTNCAYESGEDKPQFQTGSAYCMQPHPLGLHCRIDSTGNESPMGCFDMQTQTTNHSLLVDEQCLSGEMCIETDTPQAGAQCVQKNSCLYCNGFFGLFAQQQLQTSIDGTTRDCEDLLYTGSFDEDIHGRCYLDTVGSFTPAYQLCSEVQSCYDYNSQDACEQDYCYRFTNNSGNACEWNELDNELGIGVCAPQQPAQQNCYRCDIDSPLGFCTQDMCSLYGDCYFKENLSHKDEGSWLENSAIRHPLKEETNAGQAANQVVSACIPQTDMACSLYDTQDDCIGGVQAQHQPGLSLQPSAVKNTAQQPAPLPTSSQQASFNIVYDQQKNPLYGDNTQLSFSNDRYGLGDCVWVAEEGVSQGCNKNSDGSIDKLDDCFAQSLSDENIYRCVGDNQPPQTHLELREPDEQEQYISLLDGSSLSVYGADELQDIVFQTEDNEWVSSELTTYVSFVPVDSCQALGCLATINCSDCDELSKQNMCYQQGCDLYPQQPFSALSSSQDYASGEYLMMFYTQDLALNKEVVHYQPIYIDGDKPQIQHFNYTVQPQHLGGDVYVSDLNIWFDVSEQARCSGELTQWDNSFTGGNFDYVALDQSYDTTYYNLLDGTYTFSLVCEDEYGNTAQLEESIVVEGDTSITNPQPYGQPVANLSEVMLSVDTTYPATCKLDQDKVNFAVSDIGLNQEDVSLPGEDSVYRHSIAFTDIPLEYKAQGDVHIYYASCQFDNGSITEQQDGDVVSFVVDKMPPRTTVFVQEPQTEEFILYQENSMSWKKNRIFQLNCSDQRANQPFGTWGCDSIYYCVGPYNQTPDKEHPEEFCTDNAFNYASESSVITPQYNYASHDQYLYYYSVDKGGFEEELHRVNTRLRDTTFNTPDFTPFFTILSSS